jgi:peroxiredoxin
MKKSLYPILLAACLAAVPVYPQGRSGVDYQSEMPPDAHQLKTGDAAPDFSLLGIDGKTYSLADFKSAKLLMVVFLSNHCPYSHAAETRIIPFVAEMRGRSLAVVAINPNHPDAVRIDELGYSKYTDSYEDMKLYAREKGFNFPYLYDGATQATAKAYGCLATPHVFLFDEQRHLRYNGRFDDSRFADPATVTSQDARHAVEALLAGRPVPVEVTRVQGCSTKWLSKTNDIAELDAKWKAAPVPLELIDASGVAALVRNDTKKLRLINVWSTSCLPCIKEFPALVSISRRLNNRDFELITISVDDPKDQAGVQKFLQNQHAAIPNRVKRSLKQEGRDSNNYLFTGASIDTLAQALDPSWPGPLPYTIVISPGGKVFYRHTGEMDVAELQAKVIDKLGAYYSP